MRATSPHEETEASSWYVWLIGAGSDDLVANDLQCLMQPKLELKLAKLLPP